MIYESAKILNIAPLFIAILALVFTLISFWYMNLREGKLIVTKPLSYAIYAPKDNKLLHVRFPLTFYNNGAATRSVQNIRVTLQQNDNESNNLYFSHTSLRLISLLKSDDTLAEEFTDDLAYQFAIEGRKTYSKIFGFEWSPAKFVPSEGKCKVVIEARLDSYTDWEEILDFYIEFTSKIIEASKDWYAVGYTDPDMQQTWESK